jgi:ribosomal protein L29
VALGRIVRSAIVAFLFTLVAVSSPSTAFSAVTDYKKVVALFQKSNASFESDIEALEENFEVQMELIDTTYTVTTTKIEVEAQSELTEISSVLGLKIDASQKVISEALASISTWGAVEVSKDLTAPRGFSQHPGAESYLSCQPFTTAIPVTKPTVIKWPCANRTIDYPRPAKISKWDPTGSLIFGTEWRIGDQTTLFISYDDKDYRGHLVGVDQMIAAGEIKPTNPTEFSRFSTILKTEPLTLANLTSTRERQLNTVAATKSKKLSTAASLRESQIEDLEEELAEKKEKLQALQSLDNLGVLAAKRAAKNIKNFDKAFAVAVIFEEPT